MTHGQPVTRRELRRAPTGTTIPSAPPVVWLPDAGASAPTPTAALAAPAPAPAPAPTHLLASRTTAPDRAALTADGQPLTRRALREAERAAERAAQQARVRDSARTVTRAGSSGRHAQPATTRGAHRAPARAVGVRPTVRPVLRRAASRHGTPRWARPAPAQAQAVGLMMAIAFLLGGVTSVQLATAEREDRAIAAAAQAEEERRERADAAAEARLTGQATAVAAQRRLEALGAAGEALAAANAALVDATPMVGAETTDPLVEASARLAALVERAPDPGTVLGAPVPPTTIEAAGQVTTLAATGPATPDTPSAAPSGTPAPTTTPADGALQAAGRAQGPATLAPTNPAALVALDGAMSEELLRAAEEVSALAEQVRRAAEEAAAAQAAAAHAAEEARIAAEQAAAAELARKIAAADAAPNGDIPVDVLCGVSFDARVLLRCDAAAALEQLNVAFRDHFGQDLSVSDSYRTYDEQVAARANKGDLAATPGKSNHGRGLAIDLNGFGAVGQFDRPFYRWMAQNARDFGWHHPRYMDPGGAGPLEPWHWEFDTGTG